METLARRVGNAGASGRLNWKRSKPDSIAADHVKRQFARTAPNQLWVTDVTEHPTREGKIYCAVVLDTYSRRVVGSALDSSPNAALVTNALGMAIGSRRPPAGTVIHSDQGTVGGFTWPSQHPLKLEVFDDGDGGLEAGRPATCRTVRVGSGERIGYRGRRCARLGGLRPEPNSRTRSSTTPSWRNRRRRHSQLGMLSPTEFERSQSITVA